MNAIFDKYEEMGAYHWRECDRRSREYNPPLAARYGAVVKRAPAGRVLDVGAGDGYLAAQLAAHCREVAAVEYEPSGVALARRMLADLPNVTVQQGSTYDLAFEDASFDGVVMADVIEHLDEPGAAAAEMARVLADDGVALITMPHLRSDRIWDERHVQEFTAEQFNALPGEHFGSVELIFRWPRLWSDVYRTRIGWRLLRMAGRMEFNPFGVEVRSAERHCQMFAVRKPLKRG